jgi:transcriptional antiterminator NusG
MSEKKQDQMVMGWFVLRVQSNREERVRSNLEALAELQNIKDRIPDVRVPTESVTEMRAGKRHLIQRKLYPGYVIVQVEVDEHGHIPDDLWHMVRETNGVGDFIGGERPWPLRDDEVARMLGQAEEIEEAAPKLKIDFKEGQLVRIKEGPFKGREGYVDEVNPTSGKVRVIINIFNRSTPVQQEYWQVEAV